MLEIHTTGGGYQLEQTLNGVAAFIGTNNSLAFLNIGLIAGVIVLIFQLIFGTNLRQTLQAYFIVALMSTVSLGHQSDVIIFDKTEGNLWFRTVSNVPTSIAYVGSLTSSVSEALTRQVETVYASPTNLSYQRHGMLFGASLATKSARWRAVTSSVHENLTNFMDQCVLDAVDLRYVSPDIVTRSGDLGATIAANMPASLAYYDVMTSQTRLCSDGWPDLSNAITSEIDVILGAQAASTFQGPDAAVAVNDIRNTLSDFGNFVGMASASAEQQIRQAVLIAAFDDAAHRGIAATGNAAAMQQLQSARAEVQTRSSYQAVGSNALSWVPYLKIVFENLYYGAFPIALFLMMTPFAATVARGYFGGFVWLASWEPLSAILHNMMMNATADRFQTVTSASTGGAYTDSVISWANHLGVYSVGQDVGATAGYLMMSVPFLAYAIFFGASRMTGMATSMLAVSQNAASETGREVATGNFSYANASVGNTSLRNYSADNYARNNASFDNVSANRTVTSPFRDMGRSSWYNDDGTLITRNADGTFGFDGGSSRVNTATSVGLGSSITSSLRRTANELMERGSAARNSFENSLNTLNQQSSSFVQSIQNGESFVDSRGMAMSDEARETVTEAWGTLNRFANDQQISRSTAMSLGAYAAVGLPEWTGLPVQFRSELTRQGVSSETYTQLAEATQSAGLDRAVSTLSRASKNFSSTDTSSIGTNTDSVNRTSIDDVVRLGRQAENFERAASSYSEAADRAETAFVDNRVDLSGAFADWMMDTRGMNETQVAEVLNGRGDQGLANSLRGQFAQRYINDIVEPQVAAQFSDELPMPRNPGGVDGNREPYDYNQSTVSVGALSDRQLAIEMGIISGYQAIPSQDDAEGAVSDRQSEIISINERGRNRSIAGIVGRHTGGSLSSDGIGVEWTDADGTAGDWTSSTGPVGPTPLTAQDRDTVIRTILGEAANEPAMGQAAVAHVIRNRVYDERWPPTASGVALQPKQFSAWNEGAGGNNLPYRYNPGDAQYESVGMIVDEVFSGKSADITDGATHYYSPVGMDALVDQGSQPNRTPTWLPTENVNRAGPPVEIGGHIFTGRVQGE